jgi:hypothetical protein
MVSRQARDLDGVCTRGGRGFRGEPKGRLYQNKYRR